MKKQLLLSLLVVVFTSNSFAQSAMEESHKHDRKVTENFTPTNNSKAGGGWFNYGREIQEISTDASGYYGLLHTDSSMITGYIDDIASGGTGDTVYYNVRHHSRGQFLDPTSFNFSPLGLDQAEFFGVGEGFILDSIQFPYQYNRVQTQNPDKLIIQIYNENSGIEPDNPQSWGPYYKVGYDYTINKGIDAVQTIEYDLTVADATLPDSTGYQIFALDPPIDMPNGGFVAATYTFIAGNPFNVGDTLADSDLPWVVNKRNSFFHYYIQDAEPLLDPGYENYNLAVTSDVQYDISTNGWNGSYVPGNVWSNVDGDVDYHQNIWFHLTGIVSSTTNISAASSIKLYPNPANNKINIVFNNENDVKNVTITDVTGRVVYTKKVAANTDVIEVATEKYTAGIYFCEIKGATTVETIKFTKIK